MMKIIAIIVGALGLGLVLAFAAAQPDTFRVERTASINAPADRLYPLINDLHQFNTWNPFEKGDPAAKGEYRGPAVGPGAAYDFYGGKSGKGSISIVNAAPPSSVTMKLDMLEPMEGHNVVEFTIAPRGAAAEVTWAMHGPRPFVSKLIGVFLNMDRMIGSQFEAGLAGLKAKAELAS
jgi:hypothetical protein